MSWIRYRWVELTTLAVLAVLGCQGSPWWWTLFGAVVVWFGRQEYRVRRRAVLAVPRRVPVLERGEAERA